MKNVCIFFKKRFGYGFWLCTFNQFIEVISILFSLKSIQDGMLNIWGVSELFEWSHYIFISNKYQTCCEGWICRRFWNKRRNERNALFGNVPILLILLLIQLVGSSRRHPATEVLENSIFMTNVVLASIHRNNSVVKFYDNVKVETIECETTFSGRRSIFISMFPFEVRSVIRITFRVKWW